MNYQDIENIDGFTITNVLTPEECREWITAAEDVGFAASGVRSLFAGNRERACFVSPEKVDIVWERISSFVKNREHYNRSSLSGEVTSVPWGNYAPVGVNPLLRCSKYFPDGDFRLHHDTCYARDESYVGMMTILIYLNDDFEGGETVIFENMTGEAHVITPEVGKVFAFYHFQGHAGLKVTTGNKFIARSEIMFSKLEDYE